MYNISMKRLCLFQKDTKKGVASLYVVLFSTILFGVITLSFMRIILSEAGQSSDDDLSQSAYDSAMAGVEDAKRAVNRYYTCLRGSSSTADCDSDAHNRLFDDDCTDGIGLARYLYGDAYGSDANGWEVKVQESDTAATGSGAENNSSDQAYTCVVISDVVPDYRGTLTADTRTRVIPLAVYDGTNNTRLNTLNKIRFKWYSRVNEGSTAENDFQLSTNGRLPNVSGATVPPTVQLAFIHIGSNISGANFYDANNGIDYATMLLLPSYDSSNNAINEISRSELTAAGNAWKGDHTTDSNMPFKIKCVDDSEFACTVDLVTGSFGPNDSVFLVASLPYGDKNTDFAAEMIDASDKTVELVGSQISVDSTGRTSQLVRRVETRLDPADLYFPYPMYALDLSGDGSNNVLSKNFWITANCWYSQPRSGNSSVQQCVNNGSL